MRKSNRLKGIDRSCRSLREHEHDVLAFDAAQLGLLLAQDLEAALLEDADRADVVLGDVRVERAIALLVEEDLQRSRGDSPAPVLAADPVADLALAGDVEAADVAGHAAVEEDRASHALVGEDLRPVRDEGVAVAWRKRRHSRRLGV